MKSGRRTISFGDYTIDRINEELSRGGTRIKLQPQAMKVLLMLVDSAGDVVTRTALQNAVWDGNTHVDFDQGLNWCIRRIREVLDDDALHPRFVETIPRRGYRFLAESIRRFDEEPSVRRQRLSRFIAAAAVALVSLLTALRVTPAVHSVTVVVLPFENLTGESRNDMLADRLTEDVINRVGGSDADRLKVIDRLTAAKFKRSGECIIHIGQQLNAQFVVEGSLQPSGRVTAALYRVRDNTQVWATAVAPRQVHGEAWATIGDRIVTTFSGRSSKSHLD